MFAETKYRKSQELTMPDAIDTLDIMINGKRLKDIADLPLDLAV
jgi:hypothetical protein